MITVFGAVPIALFFYRLTQEIVGQEEWGAISSKYLKWQRERDSGHFFGLRNDQLAVLGLCQRGDAGLKLYFRKTGLIIFNVRTI